MKRKKKRENVKKGEKMVNKTETRKCIDMEKNM